MCKNYYIFIGILTVSVYSLYADSPKDQSLIRTSQEEVGINSFKELGQVLDEQINVLNEFFDQAAQSSLSTMQPVKSRQATNFDVKVVDDSLEVVATVPHVENSETIKAHVNTVRNSLKVVVPQKDRVTKVVIKTIQEKNSTSVKKVTQQRSEQRHAGKNLQSFQMSSNRQVSYKTVPFAVDLSERMVEYKDNDLLVITVRKVQMQPAKKAQPRTIPVSNK